MIRCRSAVSGTENRGAHGGHGERHGSVFAVIDGQRGVADGSVGAAVRVASGAEVGTSVLAGAEVEAVLDVGEVLQHGRAQLLAVTGAQRVDDGAVLGDRVGVVGGRR